MYEDIKKSKIDRFLRDEAMADSVYSVIRDYFLKRKGVTDVQYLAAERVAIDLLADSWKELKKYKIENDVENVKLNQVGL